jgi:glycosyltransferase involved in cell wall biosynthesis
LRHGKNIRKGLMAFAKLRQEGKLTDFQYTVVGDGYLLEGYKQNAKELGLEDCVEFVGQKTHEEIAQLLTRSDVMLVTSNTETFCIPAIEAAAAGVPVVSTKCGGPEGFLTADAAEMCEVDDADSMADALWRMVQRLPSLEEEKIRAVSRPFDGAAVAHQAISYYKEVL